VTDEGKRMHRVVNMQTGEESDWQDVREDEETADTMLAMHESLAQTLAWENGGRYIFSRDRFEKAYEGMRELSDNIVPEFRLSHDVLIIELMNGNTGRPLIEGTEGQA